MSLFIVGSVSSSPHIFSFSLEMPPSRALVEMNCRFVFIPPNSRANIYDDKQLQRALKPSITHIQLNWNFTGVA